MFRPFTMSRLTTLPPMRMLNAIGLRGIHGGALDNSAAAEAMTSVLIFINKTYTVDGAGVQITGKLNEPAS